MASLHKDPLGRSPYFYCAITLPDGKRTFRSTKQKVWKAAMDVCLKWERAARLASGGTLTEVQSRKIISDILESTGNSPLKSVSVQEFFGEWLKSKETTTAKSTARRYKDVLDLFMTSP